MTWWMALASIAGSALQNNAANNAAGEMTDAQNAASQQQIDLARDIYGDQRGLFMPSYLQGQDARNMYAALYGIAPQSYTGSNAFAGGGSRYAGGANGTSPDGSLPTPIAEGNGGIPSLHASWSGHDPSLWNSISTGNIGNQAWWREGGPSLFHSTLVEATDALGLPNFVDPFGILKEGTGGSATDIWGTPQDNAADAGRYDYAGYVSSNPDVQNWFNNLSDRDARYAATAYDINGDGRLSQAEAGQMHYEQHGQREGRAINPAASTGAATATGGASAGGTGATAATPPANAFDPMQAFYNSPDYKLAQQQFLNFDVPEIQGAFATQGKAISGAQQKALADRGTRYSTNAFADYKGSLANLAGMGQTAGSQVANAAGQYGATASNAFGNIGMANANAAAIRGQNQQNMFNSVGRAFGSQSNGWV